MAQVAEDGSKCGQSYDTKSKIREHVSPWSSLFVFTTKNHITVLCTAVFLNVTAGAIKPTVAIFLGYLFDELVNSRTENVPGAQVVKDVAKWCLLLAGLGFSAWIINGGYFALWMIFGDMQAKSAREKLFIGLLENDMNWYDLQMDGIGSLLTRIQT
jgi:ATP-binding cassette, subfamily B (MDR/TAP), member 1